MIKKLPQIAKLSLLMLVFGMPKLIVDSIMNFITNIRDLPLRRKLMGWSGFMLRLYEDTFRSLEIVMYVEVSYIKNKDIEN